MCFFCTFQLHLVLHSAAVLLCSVKVVPLRLYVVSVGLNKIHMTLITLRST